jgi:uncharacterized protein YlzI (FlbEa/FlbD family)
VQGLSANPSTANKMKQSKTKIVNTMKEEVKKNILSFRRAINLEKISSEECS